MNLFTLCFILSLACVNAPEVELESYSNPSSRPCIPSHIRPSQIPTEPYLSIKEISHDGSVVILDDGSEWKISSTSDFSDKKPFWVDSEKVIYWSAGDSIEIQFPNMNNPSSPYVLVNLSRQEKTTTSLKIAPSNEYANCLLIADYDIDEELITLSDDSQWYLPTSSKEWHIGDELTLMTLYVRPDFCVLWNHAIQEWMFVFKTAR